MVTPEEFFVREKFEAKGYTVIRGGWPDFIAVMGDDIIVIEVKREGGKLTANQEWVKEIFESLGIRHIVEHPTSTELATLITDDTYTPIGIFDPDAPDKIIAAARDNLDWGFVWCCLKLGMHPSNILKLKPENLSQQNVLVWRRVKNQKPMRMLLEDEEAGRIRSFIKHMNETPRGKWFVWDRVNKTVKRAGYEGGPRVLRKTFILNELRKHQGRADMIDLVAQRAGCSRVVVMQHYLDLEQWTRIQS